MEFHIFFVPRTWYGNGPGNGWKSKAKISGCIVTIFDRFNEIEAPKYKLKLFYLNEVNSVELTSNTIHVQLKEVR